jgi:ribonuclease HI
VRGHSGHPENERADALARGAIAAQLQHRQDVPPQ